jgi:hypothetical protein
VHATLQAMMRFAEEQKLAQQTQKAQAAQA